MFSRTNKEYEFQLRKVSRQIEFPDGETELIWIPWFAWCEYNWMVETTDTSFEDVCGIMVQIQAQGCDRDDAFFLALGEYMNTYRRELAGGDAKAIRYFAGMPPYEIMDRHKLWSIKSLFNFISE